MVNNSFHGHTISTILHISSLSSFIILDPPPPGDIKEVNSCDHHQQQQHRGPTEEKTREQGSKKVHNIQQAVGPAADSQSLLKAQRGINTRAVDWTLVRLATSSPELLWCSSRVHHHTYGTHPAPPVQSSLTIVCPHLSLSLSLSLSLPPSLSLSLSLPSLSLSLSLSLPPSLSLSLSPSLSLSLSRLYRKPAYIYKFTKYGQEGWAGRLTKYCPRLPYTVCPVL